MDTSQPAVDVIIPSYNGWRLLRDCLDSLESQTYPACQITVIDDGSTDNTVENIARDHPEVCVVRREKNGGFCRAVNTGIQSTRNEYVFLLNNDMTLDFECIERLVKALRDAPKECGVVGPLMLFRDAPSVIYGAGDRLCTNGRPESIGFREKRADFVFDEKPFGISAGAALYKRVVLEDVGPFDERFVAYFEDSDWNFRARLYGYSVQVVPEAIVYHLGGASLAGRMWWRSRQCFRNHALLIMKNMPLPVVVRHAPAIIRERIHQARRVFGASRIEFGAINAFAVLVRAGLSLVIAMPHGYLERRRVQKRRTLSAGGLDALLSRPHRRS
ncbi:MAG: glycosyltransferase family 2 protein [Candidatus Hydrogenedentes bacterium]|nr:glycosyltransferase family 2 protein [Candidatus Hydrogenedentota bacterium]